MVMVAIAEVAREQQLDEEDIQITFVIWAIHVVSTFPSSHTVSWT